MVTKPRAMRIPLDLWTEAVAKAKAEGTSVTVLVVTFLREYVSR